MRGVCYLPVLLLVHFVNGQPINYERSKRDDADQVSLENQEYASPESKADVDDPQKMSERYESFIQENMLSGSDQPIEGVVLGNAASSQLDDRGKRSNYDDLQLDDAEINRLQEVLDDTGKSLENLELADEKPRNEPFDSSGRMKRTASRANLDYEANEDASQDEANVEEDDSRDNESDETVAESEEGSENVAELDSDEANEETDSAEESDDTDSAEESDDTDTEETEEDGAEEEEDADEDDIDAGPPLVQKSDAAAADETSTLDRFLDEVNSLDEFLEDLGEEAEEYSQLRDDLGSLLASEYVPEDTSRTRRETLKRLSADDLKSISDYNGYTRETLAKALQLLAPPKDEVEKLSAIGKIHEPQPAEREAVRVPKDSSQMPPPPPQTEEKDKGPQTKEEKELEKVIEMRKAEESIVSKEQDEVIKAEHLAHTFQEDLHDVMREIRALKLEINTERKEAEKVSAETKEAQKDLEMHDERKYNARRKVDELYLRLTDLESDTCDNRSKRKALRRYVEAEHYVLARAIRRVREKRARKQDVLQEPAEHVSSHEQSKSGDVQQVHKADDLAAVAADPQAVARQAQPCEQNSQQTEAKKKDEEYNNILQQIIIGEAQVKVEDVQVSRAEEEAVSLHKRLSNVLSKLAALSIEMKNLQTQAQVSGKRAREAQATLAYHDQILFNARKKVNAALNLESDLQRSITDQRMNKNHCSSAPASAARLT